MLIKPVFYKTIFKYHRLVGLIVAAHLVILSFTGLMLLFKDEVQHANHSKTQSTDQKNFADKFDQVHKNLLRLYPNDKPLDIYPDDNNPQIIQARVGINGSNKVKESRAIDFDYQTTKEIQVDTLPASQFYNWILTLHRQLFMGQRGQIYIGCVGIAFILMNITGLFLFLKKQRNALTESTWLTKLSYAHQYLGIICLCWGIIVGTTGTLLALNPIFTKNFQETTLKQLIEKYHNVNELNKPDVPLKTVINAAFKAKSDGVIWYIVFPGMERGIQNHYLVLMHGTGIINKYFNEYLVISAKSAELKEIIQLPILMQLALMATPFHFANYGGITLKVFWALFAVCTLGFVLLGIIISCYRRSNKWSEKLTP